MGRLQLLPAVLWQSVSYGDPDAFLDWNLQHALTHQALAMKTTTAIIPLDSLRDDPFPHGELHRNEAAALGLPVIWDFTNYQLKERDSFDEFMLAHSEHHRLLASAAGL